MRHQEKICIKCGRQISWRKKWERCWDEVKYCSQKCQRAKLGRKDELLERQIIDFLPNESVSFSHIFSEAPLEGYSKEEVRMALRRLKNKEVVKIIQGGRERQVSFIKGDFLVSLL